MNSKEYNEFRHFVQGRLVRSEGRSFIDTRCSTMQTDSMTTPLFDTRQADENLKNAGCEPQLAKAIVLTIEEAVTGGVSTKADITSVKADIADLRTELKGDIADLRTELKGDIADLRTELKTEIASVRGEIQAKGNQVILAMVAVASVVVAAIKLI